MIDHHAVLYITPNTETVPKVLAAIESEYESVRFFVPTLSIGEVRRIIERSHQMPFASVYQYVVINTDTIPVEAQNALLKILEEPPKTTRFLLIVRPHTTILPTLRSRLLITISDSDGEDNPTFTSFTSSSISDRLAMIANFAKRKRDDEFNHLRSGLTQWLQTHGNERNKQSLFPLLQFLQLRGASKKMIWEDIALRL